MKKAMSVAEQIWLLKTVSGFAWVIVGISGCFENIVCSTLQIVGLLICIINIIRVSAAQKENSDEMAEENLCKAKAKTLDIMHKLFCVVSMVAMLALGKSAVMLDWSKIIPAVFFVVLGVGELLVGINFRKLEVE